MTNPYSDLPPSAFWRSAVAEPDPAQIRGLWQPKFLLEKDAGVSTYGSCFAQHIGRALSARGYNWLNTEQPPEGISIETARDYNYGIFSSRTGNIYTTTLLLQWAQWAFEDAPVPDEIWQDGDRFYDPFRPRIEPGGFESPEEVLRLRAATLDAFRRSVTEAGVFVFTLGLTERWINQDGGYEYPMCPGTAGGRFDPDQHQFDNLDYRATIEALRQALAILRKANRELRFILTVSPVPLTATASGEHVLTATTRSKSILRAVAGRVAEMRADTDYFPSYEIITSPVFGGRFFERNLRSVTAEGVDFVMNSFFRDMADQFGQGDDTLDDGQMGGIAPKDTGEEQAAADRLVCEEELLAAFGQDK